MTDKTILGLDSTNSGQQTRKFESRMCPVCETTQTETQITANHGKCFDDECGHLFEHYRKPTLGLFGNEVQNKMFAAIIDDIKNKVNDLWTRTGEGLTDLQKEIHAVRVNFRSEEIGMTLDRLARMEKSILAENDLMPIRKHIVSLKEFYGEYGHRLKIIEDFIGQNYQKDIDRCGERLEAIDNWILQHDVEGQKYGNEFEQRDHELNAKLKALEARHDYNKEYGLDLHKILITCMERLDRLEGVRHAVSEHKKWVEYYGNTQHERIAKLEELWGTILSPESYVALKARIEKLESYSENHLSPEAYIHLSDRLMTVEKVYPTIQDAVKTLNEKLQRLQVGAMQNPTARTVPNQKPEVCPLCNGTKEARCESMAERQLFSITRADHSGSYRRCELCQATGVIWRKKNDE